MQFISRIAAVAALASVAMADDAPAQTNPTNGITYSATLPATNATTLSGAIKIASAPGGDGVNVQVSLYNLPSGGNLTYGLYTGNVASGGDCSNTGSILDPNSGVTGSKCASDQAACEVGALSDKHGDITITSGGSGTGYFAATYIDKYISMKPSSDAFFGKGSFVVTDSSGGYVACANFVNAAHAASSSKEAAHKATQTTAKASATGSNSDSNSGSDASSGLAVRTAAPVVGAGLLGLAALMI